MEYIKTRMGERVYDYVATLPVPIMGLGENRLITQIRLWYNFTERSWVGMFTDDNGSQIDASEYAYSRVAAQYAIESRYRFMTR